MMRVRPMVAAPMDRQRQNLSPAISSRRLTVQNRANLMATLLSLNPGPLIRIHVADHQQADAVWLALVGQEEITAAELHLDGFGYLWDVVRCADGRWTTRRIAPQDRRNLPEGPAPA